MMGWDGEQLGRQPAPVVRALMHRAYSQLAWDRGLVAAARAPLARGSDFDARVAKQDAMDAVALLEALVFPEDD